MLLLLLQLPLSEDELSSDGEVFVRNQVAALGKIPLSALKGTASELESRSLFACGGDESLTFVDLSIDTESEFGILFENRAAANEIRCFCCFSFDAWYFRHSRLEDEEMIMSKI